MALLKESSSFINVVYLKSPAAPTLCIYSTTLLAYLAFSVNQSQHRIRYPRSLKPPNTGSTQADDQTPRHRGYKIISYFNWKVGLWGHP